MKKNVTTKKIVKTASEVVATCTIAGASYLGASEMIGVGTGVVLATVCGAKTIDDVPKKVLAGAMAGAITSAAISTTLIVKKLGFFKKPNGQEAVDINRQQVETFTEK